MMKYILFLLAISCRLFSENYEIVVESSNPDACSAILNGLEGFNARYFQQKDKSFELNTFVIYAKDGQSKTIGGLCGYIFEGASGTWAYVDYAWVDESKRHQGIGTQLFEKMEIFANAKRCDYIQLFTFAYQAVGFYQKLGFECVGIIPEWIENYEAVFFRKQLSPKKQAS